MTIIIGSDEWADGQVRPWLERGYTDDEAIEVVLSVWDGTFRLDLHERRGLTRAVARWRAAAGQAPLRAPRAPGRPPWIRSAFDAAWSAAGGPDTPPYAWDDIAERFRALDGSLGLDPDYLRRLRSRRDKGGMRETPE